jgi:hypothetical protein
MGIAVYSLEEFGTAGRFLDVTFNERPWSVSIEVAERSNVCCDFRDYRKIGDHDAIVDLAKPWAPITLPRIGELTGIL